MSPDEIEVIAKRAGFPLNKADVTFYHLIDGVPVELSRAIALAIEAERAACAQLCRDSDRYRGEYFAQKILARGASNQGT